MHNEKKIYDLLVSNGFRLIEQSTSDYFGDYFDIITNAVIELRFSSSKSINVIDIRSWQEKGKWYDLALVSALLQNENNLTKITTLDELINFLKNDVDLINDLFKAINYPSTKKKLNELGSERARQMFPGVVRTPT